MSSTFTGHLMLTVTLVTCFVLPTHHILSHGLEQRGNDKQTLTSTAAGMETQWVIVRLGEQEHMSTVLSQYDGVLSFLDGLHGWTMLLTGSVARIPHGCTKCLTVTTQDNIASDSEIQAAIMSAINGGAELIYMMTSLHDVKTALNRMTSSDYDKGLTISHQAIFNPCSHFAQPLFGINRTFGECTDRNWIYSYLSEDFSSTLVTGMCESCGKLAESLPSGRVYCDPSTPNVMVQPGTFARSVFGNSLWRQESFWAMFFYVLKDEVADGEDEVLKLSYLIQRLLWEVKGSVSFMRSHGLGFKDIVDVSYATEGKDRENKDHEDVYGIEMNKTSSREEIVASLCADKHDEPKLEHFVHYLNGWVCPEEDDIFECVRKLSDEFLMSKLLTENQVNVIYEYLSDISTTKYDFFSRNLGNNQPISSYSGSKINDISFLPSSFYRIWSEHPFTKICSKLNQLGEMGRSRHGHVLPMVIKAEDDFNGNVKSFDHDGKGKAIPGVNYFKTPVYSEVALVIVFKINDAATQIQMAQYFDFMYGRHFKHIVYCTSGAQMVHLFAKMYPQPMNYIDLKTGDPRLYPHLCVSETMRMYQDVKGYLQISSDTLFNPWSFEKMTADLETPWLPRKYIRTAKLAQPDVISPLGTAVRWYTWNDPTSGQIRVNATIHELTALIKIIEAHLERKSVKSSKSADKRKLNYLQKYKDIVKKFLKEIDEGSLNSARIHYGSTAIFYVPTKFRENFMLLSDEFYRFNVHSDIAVPTMLHSFAEKNDVKTINGTCVWTTHTSLLLTSYNPEHMFLFPWQLHMMGSADRSKFMCQTYLPRVDASVLSSETRSKNV